MGGDNSSWYRKKVSHPPEFNAVFYIAARVHGVFLPLAVVSQIPTSNRTIMTASKASITDTACHIHRLLSDPSCHLALRAEVAAAAETYSDGNGPPKESLPDVKSGPEELERPSNLQSTYFPFTTSMLLRCLTSGTQWHHTRGLTASEYWSELPVGTFFRREDRSNLAVVFDVTDPEAVACGVLSWPPRLWLPVSRWRPIIDNVTDIPLIHEDILHMLWKLPEKPVPAVKEMHGDAVKHYLKNTEANPCHTQLVPLTPISCPTLVNILKVPNIRDGIKTLSFSSYALVESNDASLWDLACALHTLPLLESVYVADLPGPPTETSRKRADVAQFKFLDMMQFIDRKRTEKKLCLSLLFISQLKGSIPSAEQGM